MQLTSNIKNWIFFFEMITQTYLKGKILEYFSNDKHIVNITIGRI